MEDNLYVKQAKIILRQLPNNDLSSQLKTAIQQYRDGLMSMQVFLGVIDRAERFLRRREYG